MRRFFIEPAKIIGHTAFLTEKDARHLTSVLRMKEGEEIYLFDGTGKSYRANIEKISRKEVRAKIISSEIALSSSPSLHLGQGLLKGKKMDFIVQKATELGVATLHPFVSQHSAAKTPAAAKTSRWNRISLESCKQCGRPVPLECLSATDFKSLVSLPDGYDLKLLFWEKEQTQTVHPFFSPPKSYNSIFVLIGPEGGFSEQEVDIAIASGFKTVTLGKLTLRAETATLASVAVLQYLLGNLGH